VGEFEDNYEEEYEEDEEVLEAGGEGDQEGGARNGGETRCLQCPTTTNHIRASPHAHRADSTAGTGDVYIWDLSPHHKSLESLAPPSPRVQTNPWQRSGCADMLTATLLIGLPIPEMPWGGWLLGIIRVSHSCLRGEEAVLGLQGIVAVSGNFKDPKISPFA